MDYRLSFNYLDQHGIIRSTNAQRLGLGINYNQRLFKDRLSLRFNARGSRTEDDFTPDGVLSNAAQMGPTQPIHDGNAPTGFYDYPSPGLTSPDNPVAISGLAHRPGHYLSQHRQRAGRVQPALPQRAQGQRQPRLRRYRGRARGLHPQHAAPSDRDRPMGRSSAPTRARLNTVLETYLNYVAPRKLGPGTLDLTGGYSYAKSHAEYPRVEARGLSTDALGTDGIPAADIDPEHPGHAGQQADLVLRPGELQHQRQVPAGAEPAARRLLALRRRTTRGATSRRWRSPGGSRRSRSSATCGASPT